MRDDLPTTSYAILGLLAMSPMSGYDLTQFVSTSIDHFWPISKSQVYAELGRLEEIGYLTATEVAQDNLPDKRIHEVTSAGRKALRVWLAEPDWEQVRYRNAFLVKLFFGHRMPPATVQAFLGEALAEAEQQRDELGQIADGLAGIPDYAFMRATALLGVRRAEALIGWVDEVHDELVEAAACRAAPTIDERGTT